MATEDWNWRLESDRQDVPWDCAACSLAWAMRTVGYNVTEQDVIAGLGPSRISPAYGLLDASGAGLVSYLAEMGIGADNDAEATWTDLKVSAGFQPMVAGGRGWNHWTALRMGPDAWGDPSLAALLLMNPSPGWMGVGDVLYEADHARLGPWSAVWFTSW